MYRPGATFVGRENEMATLVAALEDALAGQGQLVMLAGEPGIGKTRTADELASYAATLEARVLWGRCHEQQGMPPYWPWVETVRSSSASAASAATRPPLVSPSTSTPSLW